MQDIVTQRRLIAALRDPRRYPGTVRSVRVIETHISWVLLAGEFAYKIKKALDLGFLDFTALSLRQNFCAEEIRLNRRTAPQLYLDVVAIGGSPDEPEFGCAPALEYAVRMRRFAPGNSCDRLLRAGKLLPHHIDRLAAVIARFHAQLPAADCATPYATPATVHDFMQQNFAQLHTLLPAADGAGLAALARSSNAEFSACAARFEARRELGCVRECHGDLHLGNIALIDDMPVPFDGIEFNPALRWIDVMDELAFVTMDLLQFGRPDYAWRLLNACLEASGDYAGVSVLRFYLAYRAVVRAKVAAFRAGQAGGGRSMRRAELAVCRSHLALAQRCLEERRAALIITHGLPGSGKTTFAQFVIEQMGAIRIRSDVERKRLYGLPAAASSRDVRGDIYDTATTERTYARLHALAREMLCAGHVVIVDAAFLQRAERELFQRLAHELSVPFVIASLQATPAELRRRIERRRNDASEADIAVLEKLQALQQGLAPEERACTAHFTTAQAPDSKANARAWRKLETLLSAV